MENALKLEPLHNSYIEILKCFNKGKPLSPDQINFLRRNHGRISDAHFDRIINYYGVFKDRVINLRNSQLTRLKLSKLVNYLSFNLRQFTNKIAIQLTPKQFFQFRSLLMHELVFFHGNQILTGAPHFPGGLQHVDFLQWGNLFGVVKYEELLGESPESNILIYFEKMADRHVEDCIKQVSLTLQQKNPAHQPNNQIHLPINLTNMPHHEEKLSQTFRRG